jgi:glycosyltransferase involved in cell wall biosynthesis
MLIKLKELDKLYNFDLIHSHSGHLPHLFSQFRDIAPHIVTIHAETKGLVSVWKDLGNKNKIEKFNMLFSPLVEYCEKISFIKADRLIPVSNFVLNQIIREYKIDVRPKSSVIHNATDTDLFFPKTKDRSTYINMAYVGRFYSLKGFDTYAKSLLNLNLKGYKIKSLFVGRGDPDYLKANLGSKLPSEMYSILGRINYRDMPNIYNQSDIIIIPSLYEACPGVLLEAMSCGKIVIASDIGGMPEIIRNNFNGILFKSGDSKDLTNKLINVIDESVDIKRIEQNARKTIIERFDWKDKAKEISNEYLKLI